VSYASGKKDPAAIHVKITYIFLAIFTIIRQVLTWGLQNVSSIGPPNNIEKKIDELFEKPRLAMQNVHKYRPPKIYWEKK
jgi:hypothetical protein